MARDRSSRIDITFDLRTDTPVDRDPDSHSPTLRRYHRLLWSKPLPDGWMFDLSADSPGAYLLHDSELGRFRLSSDTMATAFVRRLPEFYDRMPSRTNAAFHRLGYTIGGMIVFPGNRIDNKQTINQLRGTHHRIADRFDLTLECIRLHYAGRPSPLAETLARYDSFFALFGDFRGYVDFFHLQDLVDSDGRIRFFSTHDGFDESPLPATFEEYAEYRRRVSVFLKARNRRINDRDLPLRRASQRADWFGFLRRSRGH